MRKKTLSILLVVGCLCVVLTSCGEDTRDQENILFFENLDQESKDSPMLLNGEKYTGPIVKYYKDGTLEFKGAYKDGVKIGPWIYYHPNGKIRRKESAQPTDPVPYEVQTYRTRSGMLYTELKGRGDDTLHYKKYHHNGRLGQELIQKDGHRVFKKFTSRGTLYHYYNNDSLVITIDTKTKQITHKGRFVDRKRDGFWFKYRKNGNKEYEKNYRQGELVGKSVDYHVNGNLDLISNYNDNGFLEGEYKNYFVEGGLWVSGQYDAFGKRTGEWIYYNENGSVEKLINYRSERYHGYYEKYYDNGNLKEKGYYQHGRKVETWHYYNEEGELLRKNFEGPKTPGFKIDPKRVL